jgi:hypothetical protein
MNTLAAPRPAVLEILAGAVGFCGGGQRRAGVGNQLEAFLVQTDLRAQWVKGPGVDFQHVFHAGDERRAGSGGMHHCTGF